MTAEILCVGTELLLGQVLNTNTKYLSMRLAELGINVYRQNVIGDNRERLLHEISQCFSEADMLILTGGLGPTFDDITKETIAEYFSVNLIYDSVSLEYIENFFKLSDRTMTENNKKQALIPEGGKAIKNNYGTAPGIFVEKDGKYAILLPGPPHEMQPMFENEVIPILQKYTDCIFVSSNIRIFGAGESSVENKIRDYAENKSNPTIAPYAADSEVYLRITAKAKSNREAKNMISKVTGDIKDILGDVIYGIDVPDLQTALFNCLKQRKVTISVAESCTGGLISKKLTDVPGISDYYLGGVCSYSNDAKKIILGVSADTLKKHGAVSEQTAMEMALGARKIFRSDLAVSTTGIAGPGGGTEIKPVGLVYIGISYKNTTKAFKFNLARSTRDSREKIRELAGKYALKLAIDILNNKL